MVEVRESAAEQEGAGLLKKQDAPPLRDLSGGAWAAVPFLTHKPVVRLDDPPKKK
jgi:hypothetical protein